MTEFDKLAEGAKRAAMMAVTYSVEAVNERGFSESLDQHDSHEETYETYVESHKYWPHDAIIVWEVSPGMALDVTSRFEYEMAETLRKRDMLVEWET